MIKNLILSSGGLHSVLYQLGALKKLIEKECIELNNVEKIYGTSAGSIVGFFLCLDIDIQVVIDYIIERPWDKIFDFKIENIMNIYDEIGLFDIEIYKTAFEPIFKTCNLNIDITLNEFYNKTKKELVVYATNYENFDPMGFSYKTHPEMLLIEAIYMSSTIPFLKPMKYNDDYYIDGVYSCRFPINHFFDNNKDVDLNDIFGLNITNCRNELNCYKEEHNIFSFNIQIIYKLLKKINSKEIENYNIPNKLNLFTSKDTNNIISFINKKEMRKQCFKKGYEQAGVYLINKNN